MGEGTQLRIGIAGCGRAARGHLERLLSLPEVEIIACADPVDETAASFVAAVHEARPGSVVRVFSDHRELLQQARPEAVFIFTPHRWHYHLAMDALQAGCHLFIEKPLSTNVQEATDILGLARGRGLQVAVGYQYRLLPSLGEARRRLQGGELGGLRLVTASMARPWLSRLLESRRDWRSDPRLAGGGVMADLGDHLVDALLWSTGRSAREVFAVQEHWETGLDVVTAATIRLDDATPVSLSMSGVSPGSLFELHYFGDRGRMRVTESVVEVGPSETDAASRTVELSPQTETIDGNFVAAVCRKAPLCCPVDEAIDTVRLIEAMARSSMTGQVVRLR
jgi:predicted dehydrogenase